MVKVLVPIVANCLLMVDLIECIAVRIPTSAIIPKAIIRMVRMVRKKFERMDPIETLKFSCINAKNLIYHNS